MFLACSAVGVCVCVFLSDVHPCWVGGWGACRCHGGHESLFSLCYHMEATSITVRVGRFGMFGCSLVVVLCLGSEPCEGSRGCFSFLAWLSSMCGLSGVLRWPSVVFHGSPNIRKGRMRPIVMRSHRSVLRQILHSFCFFRCWSSGRCLAMVAVLYGFSASVWPCSLFVLLTCSFLTSKFGQKKIMNFFAKFDRFLIPKKVAEPNGCRFSLTFESRLCRRGVRRAQWLHVFPQN